MFKFAFIIIHILFFFGFSASPKKNFHAFHTSITEIRYNPQQKSHEISIRVFTDDFETAITQFNNNQKVMIGNQENKSDAIIQKYLFRHFAFISPSKQIKQFDFLGKELEGDATWIYVELPNSASLAGYTFLNDILIDQFSDQTNLVNIFYGSQKKTILFNTKNKAEIWAF